MVFMAENLKRPVWIASGSVTNGVTQFAAPVEYRVNYRTLTKAVDIMAFGTKHMDYRRISAANNYVSTVKAFDRIWVETTPPNTTDVFAQSADFYVVGVSLGANGVADILLKKLSADNE